MKVRVQVVIEADDEDDEPAPVVIEVTQIDRDMLSIDTLGLQLAEAKDLLRRVQDVLIDEQVRTCLAQQVTCPDCGRSRAHKDVHAIVVRTLFGTVHLRSPRWKQCPCQPRPTRTFSPLAAVLPERTTPERLLEHGRDLLPDRRRIELPHVLAVDCDHATSDIVVVQ